MYARMYENGKDLMASGLVHEAEAVYQIASQGLAMYHQLAVNLHKNQFPEEAVRMFARVVNARVEGGPAAASSRSPDPLLVPS